jgi:hypothetical protein
MDLGPLLGLGLLWLVANAIRKGGTKPPARPGGPPPSARPPVARPDALATRPLSRPLPPMPGLPDATQREGSALERMLRELGRTIEEAGASVDPGARPAAPGRPGPRPARASDSASSSEQAGEGAPVRGERAVVDQDDEAEQVVRQRRAQAEARSGPIGTADHQRFDQRIRQEPADQTAVRPAGRSMERLRQAIIWREILGPPVSLRDEDERR